MNHDKKCRLRAEARRDSIMREAIRLFSEKGFKGTTTRELSAAVGVSEPILYEHFATKHELWHAIVRRKSDETFEELHALLDAHIDARDDRAFFLGLSHAIVESFLKEPSFVRLVLFSALEGDPVALTFAARVKSAMADAMRRYFDTRPESFRTCDPEVVAHTLFCAMAHHGLFQVFFVNESSKSHDEVIEGMVDMLMRGVCR